MKATIIDHPPLRLITSHSKNFPEGASEAFNPIESHLATLQGRKFYGLIYPSEAGLDYYAGLIPEDEAEERKFAELGFSIMEVSGGPCARVKLHDWSTKFDQIGPAFGAMIADHAYDPSRPQMEFYRSLNELHLLLPIFSSTST